MLAICYLLQGQVWVGAKPERVGQEESSLNTRRWVLSALLSAVLTLPSCQSRRQTSESLLVGCDRVLGGSKLACCPGVNLCKLGGHSRPRTANVGPEAEPFFYNLPGQGPGSASSGPAADHMLQAALFAEPACTLDRTRVL